MEKNNRSSDKVRQVCQILQDKARNSNVILGKMKDPENDILEVLGEISKSLASKREEIKSLSDIKLELENSPNKNLPRIDKAFLIDTREIQTLSEVKFYSPSADRIAPDHLVAKEVAQGYIDVGAKAISVLCEEVGFGGSLDYLRSIRKAIPDSYLLQKDFILNKYQVYEGRLAGANSFLIIISLVTKSQLLELLESARELNITPLIEIHNNSELDVVLDYQKDFPDVIKLVGVNNRNLSNFKVDLEVSKAIDVKRLKDLSIIAISESGLTSTAQARELQDYGYNGFLVGTAFMKTDNPKIELKKFITGEL